MREIRDEGGRRWTATVISHGQTSGYLNPRVHRPIIEFACLDAGLPRKYGTLPEGADLERLPEAELVDMLGRAKTH